MALFFRVGETKHGRSYVPNDWRGDPSHALAISVPRKKYDTPIPVGSYIPSSFMMTPSYAQKNVPYKTTYKTRDYPAKKYYKALRKSLPKLKTARPVYRTELVERALPRTKYYYEPTSWSRREPIEYYSTRWSDYSSGPSWTLLNRAYRKKLEPVEYYRGPWTGTSKFLTTTFVADKDESPLLTYSKPLSATLQKYSDPLAYAIAIRGTKAIVPAVPTTQTFLTLPRTYDYMIKREYVRRRQPLHNFLKNLYEAEHIKNLDYLNYATASRTPRRKFWTTRSRIYRFGGP